MLSNCSILSTPPLQSRSNPHIYPDSPSTPLTKLAQESERLIPLSPVPSPGPHHSVLPHNKKNRYFKGSRSLPNDHAKESPLLGGIEGDEEEQHHHLDSHVRVGSGFQPPTTRELVFMGMAGLMVVGLSIAAGFVTVFDWVL